MFGNNTSILAQANLAFLICVQLLHIFSPCNCSSVLTAFGINYLVLIFLKTKGATREFAQLLKYRLVVVLLEGFLLSVSPIILPLSEAIQNFLIIITFFLIERQEMTNSDPKRASSTSVIPGLDRIQSRPRKHTFAEEDRVLELIEQGYILYRQVNLPPFDSINSVLVNRKGKEILLSVDCDANSLPDYLETTEDQDVTNKTLRTIIEETYKEDVKVGTGIKVSFSIIPHKDNTGEESKSVQCSIPFKFYKATLWKLSKTDTLLIFSEKRENITLNSVVGLKHAIICTLCHELKTLANGITGNIELLEDDSFKMNQQQRMYHNFALCSSKLLTNRLNDLFDYLEIQNKGFRLHYTEFSLEDLFPEVKRVCGCYASEKQLDFSLVKANKLPRIVLGDKARIEQVLLNLLIKAIEFTDYGQILLSVRSKGENEIEFSVTSFGTSMQARIEQQMKNMSPTSIKRSKSNKAENATYVTENFEALSLGISQIICKEMGTKIVVKNINGKSSQFKLHLYFNNNNRNK